MMVRAVRLQGAYAPVLTPFTVGTGEIDWDSFRQHLAFLEKAGLTGVLLLGTNGEFDQLTIAERLEVVDTAVSSGVTLKLIVGGTIPDSPERTLTFVRDLAQFTDRIMAVLVAPPYYDRYAEGGVVHDEEVVGFFRRLAEVQDRVPVQLYNVPQPPGRLATAPVTPDVVAALTQTGIIIGIKDSTARLDNITAYLNARPGFQVLVGSDYVIAAGLALGAVGSITACGNVFPSAVVAVYQAGPGPHRETAQAELRQLREILEMSPRKKVATQKFLLHHLGVVARRSPVRDSRLELTGSEREAVLSRLDATAAGLVLNQEVRTRIMQVRT